MAWRKCHEVVKSNVALSFFFLLFQNWVVLPQYFVVKSRKHLQTHQLYFKSAPVCSGHISCLTFICTNILSVDIFENYFFTTLRKKEKNCDFYTNYFRKDSLQLLKINPSFEVLDWVPKEINHYDSIFFLFTWLILNPSRGVVRMKTALACHVNKLGCFS